MKLFYNIESGIFIIKNKKEFINFNMITQSHLMILKKKESLLKTMILKIQYPINREWDMIGNKW